MQPSLSRQEMIMPNRRDLNDIASYLVPNPGDEAWVVDPNQPEHMHHGQTSGEPHSDGYYMYNEGTPSWLKYHWRTRSEIVLEDAPLHIQRGAIP